MRKGVHVHHGIGGLGLGFTVTALVILLAFLEHGHADVHHGSSGIARAALDLGATVGVFTDKLTLGLGALGLLALPVTLGLFTDGLTFRLGHLAMGDTMGFLADGDTLGAVIHFTGLIGAHDLAVGLLTLDVTDGVLGFLA